MLCEWVLARLSAPGALNSRRYSQCVGARASVIASVGFLSGSSIRIVLSAYLLVSISCLSFSRFCLGPSIVHPGTPLPRPSSLRRGEHDVSRLKEHGIEAVVSMSEDWEIAEQAWPSEMFQRASLEW